MPNGAISKVVNLSRDWARAVVDVPIPTTVDVNRVNEILREVGREAFRDPALRPLLLDPPSVMGVESLDLEQVNVRMVARTLPGKQFEVGRDLRARVVLAFRDQGLSVPPPPPVEQQSTADELAREEAMSEPTQASSPRSAPEVTTRVAVARGRGSRPTSGRARTSTVVLAVLFLAIFALYLNIRPDTTAAATTGNRRPRVPAATTARGPARRRRPRRRHRTTTPGPADADRRRRRRPAARPTSRRPRRTPTRGERPRPDLPDLVAPPTTAVTSPAG